MSIQLSKLHVRFIQTQKNFHLQTADTKTQKLPISQLYIKDNIHLYLINKSEAIKEENTLNLSFKEATPALNTLSCEFSVQEIQKESEGYEDALLFFNTDADEVNQLLLLSIKAID